METRPLSGEAITQLINHSRQQNAKKDLTGILLHVGNTFFQVLEGSADAINTLYQEILNDPRHTGITRIIFETISRRYFADSSMTLTTLSVEQLSELLELPGDGQQGHPLAGLDEGRAKKLLRAFADGRWRANAVSTGSRETLLA